MTIAKCNRCGATATAGTFEAASLLLNHAVGLSRGIPCGDNYNSVIEVVEPIVEKVVNDTIKTEPAKVEISEPTPETPKTEEASYQNVEGKSGEHVTFDEAKQSKKQSKKSSY